jgi:peptidoglycan hydrolase CwlO-like protein
MLNYKSTIYMRKLILPFIAVLLFTSNAKPSFAQDSTKVDRSLHGQYLELLNKSKSFYGSKIINPERLSTYWKNVSDTLQKERKQVRTSRAKVAELQKTITDLKGQVQGKESALSTSNQKLNQITFMGMSFDKGTYNTVVWTLILVLALGLIIVIIRSAKHIHEAKYRSGLYEEIAAEYQTYKVKANDKEKKLARELQDERNKFEDYKSRGR